LSLSFPRQLSFTSQQFLLPQCRSNCLPMVPRLHNSAFSLIRCCGFALLLHTTFAVFLSLCALILSASAARVTLSRANTYSFLRRPLTKHVDVLWQIRVWSALSIPALPLCVSCDNWRVLGVSYLVYPLHHSTLTPSTDTVSLPCGASYPLGLTTLKSSSSPIAAFALSCTAPSYSSLSLSLALLLSFLCIYCFSSFALYFSLNLCAVWICRVHYIVVLEYIFVPSYELAYFDK